MALSEALCDHLGAVLSERLGHSTAVRQADPVFGGSINDAFHLTTGSGGFFVKVGPSGRPDLGFGSEAAGLELLRKAGELRVPEVLAHGAVDGVPFLLLEYIHVAEEDHGFQARFGRALAKQHRHGHPFFGLDRDNLIGMLPQVNTPHMEWSAFLVQCRLDPLVRRALANGRIDPGDVLRFERLYARLPALFPTEPPALLHGDLWKNNYIAAPDGAAVLIDPAVYYGHREMDLAMTRLFGGFDRTFYGAYQEEWPLEQGWEERIDLCNLYPLLVHLNLFGGSYTRRINALLRRFT